MRRPMRNDEIIFPADAAALVEMAMIYLILVGKHITSKDHGRPRISAIIRRRDILFYWLTRGRKAPNPPTTYLWGLRSKETSKIINSKYGFNRTNFQRIYLGKEELIQIIDYDITNNIYATIAKQHYLAWIVGLVCGIRPGTIAVTQSRAGSGQCLRWGDVTIYRDDANRTPTGTFTVQFTFRWLKGNRGDRDPDLGSTARFGADYQGTLGMKVRTPNQVHDIGLSIPHRLLDMAIGRCLLKDHDTLQSLFDGHEKIVKLKEEAKALPVSLEAKAAGRGLYEDIPAGANDFTEYLSLRAMWCEYVASACMYSWRAKAGTNVARAVGVDQARKFMNHSPESRVFEKHYDQGLYDFDAVGIAIDGAPGAKASADLSELESQAMTRARLAKQSIDRQSLITECVESHADLHAAQSVSQYQAQITKYGLRKAALKAILGVERELSLQNLSVEEWNARRRELDQRSKLFALIQERMHATPPEGASGEPTESADTAEQRDCAALIECADFEQTYGYELDPDAVGLHEDSSPNPSTFPQSIEIAPWSGDQARGTSFDEDEQSGRFNQDKEENHGSEDWKGAAIAFMTVLQDAERYLIDNPQAKIKCHLCQKDPTLSEEDRNREFRSRAVLDSHLEGNFHLPISAFNRRMAKELGKVQEGKVLCPYGCKSLFLQKNINKHLTKRPRPGDRNFNARHEELKQRDGWFDHDFIEWPADMPRPKHELRKEAEERAAAKRSADDIEEEVWPYCLPFPILAQTVRARSLAQAETFGRLIPANANSLLQLFRMHPKHIDESLGAHPIPTNDILHFAELPSNYDKWLQHPRHEKSKTMQVPTSR